MFSASEVAPVSTMASAMFFGTIIYVAVALTIRCELLLLLSDATAKTSNNNNNNSEDGENNNKILFFLSSRAVEMAQNPRSRALDISSFTSIYTLCYHCTVLGILLFYAYLCEYHPPYPHASKAYDRDEFFFLTALLILVSLFTMKSAIKKNKKPDNNNNKLMNHHEKNASSTNTNKLHTKNNSITLNIDDHDNTTNGSNGSTISTVTTALVVAPVDDKTEVLNRDQTEEWKGWMQFMFLLYHYYHAEEVYNAIRIMITCYVWMTGFGNFSFFYVKGDYSLIRVLQMLWRLNFLVLFLCLTQGTTYILYYICLLHTYFFMMVYVSMRIGKQYNYTKYGIRIKMMILAIIIFLMWDVDTGLFTLLHKPFLGQQPMLGATSGPLWEWYFRSSLDHWSTYLGMIFALNFPITSLFFRKLEAQPFWYHVIAKTAMGIVLFAAFFWWVTNPFMLEKFHYNQTNSYYGCIPLLAYIYFRNLTPWLRSHTLDLLHQIGKTTLETYLMQHHIWLTSNAKSLLTLIPGWPKMNFLIVSIIYVLVSRRLYQLTLFLRGMILPDDRTACLRNLSCMGIVLAFYYGLAILFNWVGILNLVTVGIIAVALGYILYFTIVQTTWSGYVESSSSSSNSNAGGTDKIFTSKSFEVAHVFGVFTIITIGLVWNHCALWGAGKIQTLPASCSDYVHQGSWVPVDKCNEQTIGMSYRDYDVASLGTCAVSQNPVYVWGWKSNPSSTHCRFAYKDKNTLRKALSNRNITFIGDSMVRHLYHAFCRQLGDGSAGAYNTTEEKHSDFSGKYGSVSVEFKWAPYTTNLTSIADALLLNNEGQTTDMAIFGGGAWDRLHLYGSKEAEDAHHKEIETLAQQLHKLNDKIRVTWVIPSVINSWALASVEKQQNIREDQIEVLRQVQESKGIYSSVSFVLDAKAFTAERVTESYDGVHYPLSVYDAGAQILVNAFDWLLPKKLSTEKFVAPRPGLMHNAYLGLLMLFFCIIGIFGFDGFMGASYFAAIIGSHITPFKLFYEAFSSLHSRLGLPPIANDSPMVILRKMSHQDDDSRDKSKSSEGDPEVLEELEPFFDPESKN